MTSLRKPIFSDISADDIDHEPTIIESVCMNCFKQGSTRLLLTKIPFYKEVVLMSFSCEFCGNSNNEIQSSGEIQPNGIRMTLKVTQLKDLNRRIVKSDNTSVKIEELDFEIPANSQKGEITTIEGVIERSIAGLEQDQIDRRKNFPEDAKKIDEFIERLRKLKDTNFTFTLEDISGECYIENLLAPHPDPNLKTSYFVRTTEQNHLLGIFKQTDSTIPEEDEIENGKKSILHSVKDGEWPLEELHGEVFQFQTLCPECKSPCDTNMKVTSIPHFKDVVIMATVCDVCGSKTNEVKSGGGIGEFGIKFVVNINGKEDFSRDVLKSETCSLSIPELNCEVGAHAISGRFTTVEGILKAMREQLADSGGMFQDSQDAEMKTKMSTFLSNLDDILVGNRKVTLVLDDPAGNSYIQSLSDEIDSCDVGLKITKYKRTFEQNDELGLNDMQTENYETNMN